jgi:hypothetical protein
MKQLLVIAVALASVNAFASRARVTALGNSAHLVDTQTVYNNPSDIFRLPSDYVTLETGTNNSGTTAVGQNNNAEGMIVRTYGESKFGLSLGHHSPNGSSWGLRSHAATAALKVDQQNPLELTYGMKNGDINYAGTLVYSNYNDKKAAVGALAKESTSGIRLGANSGNWDAALNFGLSNTAELESANKFTGTSAIGLNGGYWMDSMYLFGSYSATGAKEENTAGTEVMKYSDSSISLGVLDSVKKDGNELFYSVALTSSENKETVVDTKTTSMTLPVVIGVELDAASWLTLRGSVTQTVLINQSKTETAGNTTAETAPGANNTAVAVGAGLKFNKVTVDGSLVYGTAATTTGLVNTGNLLTQAGLTYWF